MSEIAKLFTPATARFADLKSHLPQHRQIFHELRDEIFVMS